MRQFAALTSVGNIYTITIQKLLSHKNVGTTMIYAHVIKQGAKRVRSSADF